MKNIRLLKRIFGILFGAVGISSLLSACHKERDCRCTYSSDGDTYVVTVTTKEPCWELDKEVAYGSRVMYTIKCDKD
ncbi:MAG: hypothetical protein JXB49_01980 [Bacteroidales bacterium]|nr:hypothetical protein [Bacteroidales bacterium]